MRDVIMVEANANVALRDAYGRPAVVTGTVAIARKLIALNLSVLPPTMLRVIDRAPTREEIQRSTERGLIPRPTAPSAEPVQGDSADDPRTLRQLRLAELREAARSIGLGTDGTRALLISDISAVAKRLGVSTTGSATAVIRRIQEAIG